MSWLGGSRAVAVLSFDVDAESPILAMGRRYADHAMVMSHQAYGPLVGVPRLLELLNEYELPATFFVPGLTADRYPEVVERIADAGHEVGHHSYSHRSPVDLSESGDDTSFGLAARWNFTPQLAVGIEGEFGDDSNSYGIGARWAFGRQ